MPDCKSCRHWDTAFSGDASNVTIYVDGHFEPLQGEWGDCQKIIRYGGSSYGRSVDEQPEVPAFLSDGSGYFAALTTEGSFSCALWEAKDV